MGGKPLNQPVVAMTSTPTGKGYWLVASDGGVFSFATAPFYGSTASSPPPSGVIGLIAAPQGNAYVVVDGSGTPYHFPT